MKGGNVKFRLLLLAGSLAAFVAAIGSAHGPMNGM